MEFLPTDIEQYAQAHTTQESVLLKKINRETYAEVLMPRMVSGHLQGRFLSMISTMIRPNFILEIGTYTGYSAICLAEGLSTTGKIITIDINEERLPLIQKFVALEGLKNSIEIITGNAIEIIPSLQCDFDLVFIDADKVNYGTYFDLVFEKVRPGGWILSDNVLWSGKVIAMERDKDTLAIDAFNKKLAADKRVEVVIVSLRDGVSIARKIG